MSGTHPDRPRHARRMMADQLLHARMPTGQVADQADEIALEAVRRLQLGVVRRQRQLLRPRKDCLGSPEQF